MIYKITGGYCHIDEEDLEFVDQFSWHFDDNGYVKTTVVSEKGRVTMRMHQLLMGRRDGMYVDHKDRNPSNNQKSNLRHISPSLNWYNSHHAEYLYHKGRLKNPQRFTQVRGM